MFESRCIAIGDIHGCSSALRVLVEAIELRPQDQLIILGDVIDRGPDSRGVIEQLLALQNRCELIPILGNHEEMLLNLLHDKTSPDVWLRTGGVQTLDSYQFQGDLDVIPAEHIAFLSSFFAYYETDTHFFVHANYHPHLPLDRQPAQFLRWLSLDQRLPPPHESGKIAIVGHTAERSGEIFSIRHLKCLDTYCYGGGWLTALDIASGQVWQTAQNGELRTGRCR